MTRYDITQQLITSGAVAVIRMQDTQKLIKVVKAIHKGGVSAIEITMTIPNAIEMLAEVIKVMKDSILIGVGSVLDVQTSKEAINTGAKFVVSPVFKPEIIETAHQQDIAAIPGTFSPGEIQAAYEKGADIIKVFPANVLGMEFFKAIKKPLPHLKLMPTGGVTLTNAGDWLKCGACVVAVGSALLDKEAIANENYPQLTNNAKILIQSIAKSKECV